MNITMEEGKFSDLIAQITGLDKQAMESAKERLDGLIKPLGSLGRLEDIAVKLAGITGKIQNNVNKRCTIIMAADNGIGEEGVASAPKEITLMQTINMTKNVTGIGALSKVFHSDIKILDIGIDSDVIIDGWIDCKVKKGTGNFAVGPAMSRVEAVKAVAVGFEVVRKLHQEGYQMIGTGEMGIGNTSTATAVIGVLSKSPIGKIVGRGAGLTDESYEKKKKVIEKGINGNNPDKNDAIDVLAKVGGLDIAGLAGCFLGAAYYRLPVIVDGVISIAAALVAYKINSLTREYMIPSHLSKEPAYEAAAQHMKINPVLNLEMRLGEGTGCPMMFGIMDAACAVMNDIASFSEVQMDDHFLVDNRE